MHILMIGAGDPPPTFIARQIEALKALGVQVSLFPSFEKHRYANAWLCRKGFTFHLPERMRALLRAADVVHYQWPGHLINYGVLARRAGKPAVLSLRGGQINIRPYLPGYEGFRRRLTRVLPRCDAYHCVSADILEAARPLGLDPAKAWVIRTGVDTEVFAPPPEPAPASTLHVAMVGALIWRKGYEFALLALRRALDRGCPVRLSIVGTGEDQERVAYTVRDLALDDRVSLLGRRTPAEVRELLQRSHVLLHTALSEGIANVTIEAMACGLPVVIADAGGAREAVRDGLDGFLVPVRDPEAVADRLCTLAESESLRVRLGASARRRAVESFGQEALGPQFVRMYESVLGNA